MKLFPSTIITYQNLSSVDLEISQICVNLGHKLSPNNPDLFVINHETGWSVELIRSLKKFISQKPFNHSNKICLIYQAENLNSESQNALLKTLEEPGENNYLILITNKPSSLLATIISRCHFIKLANNDPKTSLKKPFQISGNFTKDTTPLESLYKNKDQILPHLQDQLQIFQQKLIKDPTPQNSQIAKNIIKAINMIQSNVDPRSALDFVFLS